MKGREGEVEAAFSFALLGLVGRRAEEEEEEEEAEEEASSKIRQECSLEKGMGGRTDGRTDGRTEGERRRRGRDGGGTMFAHNYVSNLDRPFLPSSLPSLRIQSKSARGGGGGGGEQRLG